MNNWESKRKFRSIMYSKPVLVFLVLLIYVGVKGTWNLYQKNVEAKTKRDLVATQIEELKRREEFLKENLKQLNSESGVEAMVRQKFNVKKEGEEVAVIITPEVKNDVNEGSRIGSFLQHFFTGFVDIFR